MAFWNKKSVDERLVLALERLVQLKELELAAKGLTLYSAEEEGEVSHFDPEVILKKEEEDAIRKSLGLPSDAPLGVIDPGTGKEWASPETPTPWASGSGFGFGTGPEGAESTEPGPPAPRG